jgi:hypothetical protein
MDMEKDEDKITKERKQKKLRTFKLVILAAVVLLIVGVPVFMSFKIKTEGRLALRQAKNVKLAFDMISVEYYGMGISIYDSSSSNGLTKGVRERLDEVVEEDFDVAVSSYDKNNRKITSFDYTNANYMVRYVYDSTKGDTWKVYYKYLIYDYDGK